MAFYNPYEKSMSMGTFAGGLGDLLNQFLMYKMIQQMYPGKKGEQKQGGDLELNPFTKLFGQQVTPQQQGGQTPDISQMLQLLQMFGQPGR